MSAHARLSASAAHRWLRCGGSIGEGKPSHYAAEGTFAHEIAAKCLRDSSTSPLEFLGKKAKVDGFDVECTLDMIESIRVYLDACDEDLQPGDVCWIEVALIDELCKIDPDLGGTADYARYRPATKHLLVADYKHGAGVYVDVDDNEQAKVYALGAMLTILRRGHLVDDITLRVVQPRFEGAQPVRDYQFKAVQLLDFAADIQEAAERSRQPKPVLVVGEHCKFCPNARTCPELEKRQHALVAAEFGPVAQYDVKALAAALGSVALVKERIKAIEEFAYGEATRGVDIPGYKLVDKRATRQWISEGDVIEWAQKNAIDPYEPRSIVSPAKLEERIKEGAPKGKKKEAAKVLEPFYSKVSSGTTLVPIADNRPPVKLIASEDFPALSS